MNEELRLLLVEMLRRQNEILDPDCFYDTEFDALIKMLDEIIANDCEDYDFDDDDEDA